MVAPTIPLRRLRRHLSYKARLIQHSAFFILHSVKVSLSVKQLGNKNCAACCATESVVREANELIVVEAILTESACAYAHSAVKVTVEPCLGAIVLLEIGDELLGSRGKLKKASFDI